MKPQFTVSEYLQPSSTAKSLALSGSLLLTTVLMPLQLVAQELADDAQLSQQELVQTSEDGVDSFDWFNQVAPPSLDNPIQIQINSETPSKWIPDFDRVGCDGHIYEIYLPEGQDAVVTMDPSMGPLRYPLWLTGGRNVHVLGLEFRTEVQPGCDVGEAHQIRDSRANIHPRLVSGKVLRMRQSGTTYIEGVDIDLMGQEADCFVSRNAPNMSREEVKQNRNIVIVNSRCTGIEGLDDSPIGDGIHGDFFQNQGRDDIGSLVLENVSFRTSSNGITLHRWNGSVNQPRVFKMINVDYAWDERFSADSRYEISGLMFSASADEVSFENVWMNDGRGERFNYGFIRGERWGAYSRSRFVQQAEGLFPGLPPFGEFAPADRTGLEYLDPEPDLSDVSINDSTELNSAELTLEP